MNREQGDRGQENRWAVGQGEKRYRRLTSTKPRGVVPVVLPRYDLHGAAPLPVLALRDQLIVGVVPGDGGRGVGGGVDHPLDQLVPTGRLLKHGGAVLPDPQEALVPLVDSKPTNQKMCLMEAVEGS